MAGNRRPYTRRWVSKLAAVTASVLASPVAAQDAATPDPAVSDDRATIGASYVTDVIANVDGGLKRGLAWLGRADLVVDLPASRLGLADGVVHFDLIGVQDGDFSGVYVGDAQVVSNVQAQAAVRPYEAWLQLPLNRHGLSAKLGLIDLNTEFDVQSVGALFTNSSFGVGPDLSHAGENGPSIFPVTSVAAMAELTRPSGRVRLGMFNAVSGDPRSPHSVLPNFGLSGGALVILEADHDIGGGREVQFGAWTYTRRSDALAEFDASGAPRRRRQHGAYAQVEGPVVKASLAKFSAWARVGIGDDRAQAIGVYMGGGITAARGERQAGLAVAHARLGAPAITAGIGDAGDRAETTIELTYSTQVASWLRVQPDVQYVVNPGWRRTTRDALVIGLRLGFQTSLARF